jgi:signal transduction histidine kinase
MTTHEIRPKQLRALLLLLVLVPFIPAAIMVRFMLDTLRVERLAALDRLQQFHAEALSSALRNPPPGTPSDPPRQATAILQTVKDLRFQGVTARILDASGNVLAGEAQPWGQPIAQGSSPSLPGATVQLYLTGPEVLDEAISDQRHILLWTTIGTILSVIVIAGLAAMALHRQITLRELKNTSVATVAHELRTPLASMRMLVDTLREGRYRGEAQLREYLDLVAAENERLSRLAETFLSFSRLSRKALQIERTEVSAATIIERGVSSLRPKLQAADCTFITEIAPDLPPIRADADALAQVITNLLDNALKYSDPPRRVTLKASADPRHLRIEVADNGIGIAPEDQRGIFEPFYQADRKLSRSREGCGLGLAIVRDIVRAHGGRIEVASEPGKGTVFTVSIPVA